MLLTVQKDKLSTYLSVVEKGLPAKTTIPVLSGILLDATNDYLRLCSSNLEMSIQVIDHHVEIKETGSVVLPDKLVDIVRQLPGDSVKISMENTDLRAEISSDRAYFNLYGMDAQEFPHFPDESAWSDWDGLSFTAAEFKEIIRKIIFAISHDEGRPLFRAVCLKFEEGNKITAIATDTYRLARLQHHYKENTVVKSLNFLIPGRTLNEIMKIIEDADNEEIKCYFKENEIIFKYRSYTFSSRLIEGKFPDVDGVFPQGFKTRIKVFKKDLEKMLQRAILLAYGQNQMITLRIKENNLQVHVSGESGKMDEQMILTFKEGDDLDGILLNARYLLEPLRIIDQEDVTIEFNGPFGPCVFCLDQKKEGVEDVYRYLVLPIKTEKYA